MTNLDRTKAKPWKLKTAPGTSEYTMHVERQGRDAGARMYCRQAGAQCEEQPNASEVSEHPRTHLVVASIAGQALS